MEQKTTSINPVIQCTVYDSPCGRLILGSIGDALCLCDWDIPPRRSVIDSRLKEGFNAELLYQPSAVTDKAAQMLDEYFEGRRHSFDLPLIFSGSDFRKCVWQTLLSIPYGSTSSYSQVAAMIGHPKAVRAVASAIAANPISIFVPCHRIVLLSGIAGNYAGTPAAKSYLLNLEAHNANRPG